MASKASSDSSKKKAAGILSRTMSKDGFAKLKSTSSTDGGGTGLEDLRVAFNMLDKNKDGQLSVSELQMMLKRFGIEIPNELILDLFHRCSKTGSGELTEGEFLEFVTTHLTDDEPIGETPEDDLLAAFRVFDTDNNGFITRDELKTGMEMMGEQLTDEDVDNMIAMADLNKDGKIDYEEFTRLLS